MTRNTDDSTEPHRDDTPEGVLSPDDLELTEDVAELDDGRYVVPTDEDGQRATTSTGNAPSPSGTTSDRATAGNQAPTEGLSGAYAAAVTMRTPTGTDATQVETNDVRELFEELLVWYAEQMAPGDDPEDALSVLLAQSSLSVEPFDD